MTTIAISGLNMAVFTPWPAAMNINIRKVISSRAAFRGVCPDGWHLPSDSEWQQLEMFLWDEPGRSRWRGMAGRR